MFNKLLNRKLSSIALSDDLRRVTFSFQDGGSRSFLAQGHCCSESWIEHLESPGDLTGATILSVEDSAPVTQDHDERDPRFTTPGNDYVSVYNTVFRTDRGDLVLEYRNASNGYYGGFLVEVDA